MESDSWDVVENCHGIRMYKVTKPREVVQDIQPNMCFNYRVSCLSYVPTFSTSKYWKSPPTMAIKHTALQFIVKVKVICNTHEGPKGGFSGIALISRDLGIRRGGRSEICPG
jgi:hypothetical protein